MDGGASLELGKDYTKYPVGSKIDGGEIQLCPDCKRNGLLDENNGEKFYVHSQAVATDSTSLVFDMCPRQTLRPETENPEWV
jgi:hypothetical protein